MNADLFAITESGCTDSIHDLELVPAGYHIVRCDRADGRKQGGALLVAAPRYELRQNSLGRQLDLVLCTGFDAGTKQPVCVSAADETLVPVDAYHPPLAVRVSLAPVAPVAPAVRHPTDSRAHDLRPRWNFYKADYNMLYSKLMSVNWDALYKMHDMEDILNYFYLTINSILEECVPKKTEKSTNLKYHYPDWYTVDLIKNIRTKSLLHKKYKKTKLDCDYREFSLYRKIVKNGIDDAYKAHVNKIQNQFSKDPKQFWQYIKSRRGSSNRANVIMKEGIPLTDKECAQEFAAFFKKVYNKGPPVLDTQVASQCGANSARISLDALSIADVRKALARLKPKRSAGPDGIPAFIFKDCARVLAEPLLHIFNTCLNVNTFPTLWKTTRVIPVPKAKLCTSVHDYRPVAVLSTPAKEKVSIDGALDTA
ncbi:unnamed protein product [Colias eurytheme]|nr:unnamed protein product [Colias eurytheme]